MMICCSAFLPHLYKLGHHLSCLIAANSPYTERHLGIFAFGDIIEFTGPYSIRYQQIFLGPMLEFLKDKQSKVWII